MAQIAPSGQPTTLIHLTASFTEDVYKLSNALTSGADDILMKLASALGTLRVYQWNGSLPIEEMAGTETLTRSGSATSIP